MSAAGTKTRRPWVFGAVTVVMQVGHSLVAIATLVIGLLILIQFTPARLMIDRQEPWFGFGVIGIALLHILLMLATPLWHWLAARTQTRVSRLWAWLGYFIPFASYWLPARNLRELVGAAPEAARLRTLILAWGIARSLAAPVVMTAVVYGLYRLAPHSDITAFLAVAYVPLSLIAANLLSLFVTGQVSRHLATHVIDERHAEIFS